MRIFGVIPSQEEDSFGFRKEETGNAVDVEEIVLPFVETLSQFRENIRATARSIDDASVKSAMLRECDLLRDVKLPELGVRLEDYEGSIHMIPF